MNREWNDAYRPRLDALRVQLTQQSAMARALAEIEDGRRELEKERREKENERREKERLRARLRALGVDPDA